MDLADIDPECSICGQVLCTPVTTVCKHTYCRSCLSVRCDVAPNFHPVSLIRPYSERAFTRCLLRPTMTVSADRFGFSSMGKLHVLHAGMNWMRVPRKR
jgi:hypothetical protein